MSTIKQVKGPTIPRHDIAKNWAKAVNFVPRKGELIVYEKEYGYFVSFAQTKQF